MLFPAVYQNAERHCVILTYDDDITVRVVSLQEESGSIVVDEREELADPFHKEYKLLPDYPVQRAAKHFLHPITSAISVTARATTTLSALAKETAMTTSKNPASATSVGTYDKASIGQSNVTATKKASLKTDKNTVPEAAPVTMRKPTAAQQKAASKKIAADKAAAQAAKLQEKKMETQTANAAKKTATNKATPAQKASSKAATTKAPLKLKKGQVKASAASVKGAPAKAPAKKAAPAKKTAAERDRETYAGRNIKHLVKDLESAGVRAGTKRAAFVTLALKAKNTDDLLGKTFTVNGEKDTVVGSYIAWMVKAEIIELK